MLLGFAAWLFPGNQSNLAELFAVMGLALQLDWAHLNQAGTSTMLVAAFPKRSCLCHSVP